ncbi:HEAT repeat domain-containing protein [Planktothrix prolifica]|uniref:HEAT repeat domain-containing protein n=1 Tax=Planktothrix prolifica TaxID=54307 RepID=UPI000406AE31|nr:HEAT repeat domain-containing protein [Planktothrix prolifica]
MDPSILGLLLSIVTNLATGPINVYDWPKNLINKFKGDPKPINHDLQKAIKIAYLQALLEIAQEFKAGIIQPFRLYLPTEIDQKIEQWKTELEQVKNAKDETEISSPLQDTAEIEQLLLSHGKPIGDRLQELETRLISQALQGIADIPPDYQNQIQTGLFSRIYAHFVEQLKTNDRAYRAFELEYLPTINASLTEIGVGQEQVALTMTDMFSVVNRTDQNVQKIIDILNPKSLTLEDWQEICRQNLAQQKQLTTNPFTNANGVTPQLDEIYVPLAIVERKPPKPPSRNQQEEKEEKEEEKLIPITEESFFEEVLRQGKSESQGRKIAIIGEPGSGKTTRLQKIADWILEENLGLPIWISLADLTQPTITQYIEEIWLKQTGKSLTIDELTQQKDRIWLLLDGLDEMTSRVEMRHVSAVLGGWVQAARVVVTCRVNVWEADKNAFSGFDVFRNLEFNPEQVTDYIRRWFAGMGDAATGESLEAALAKSENSRLKELIQNPLRLWMLCQIWQTGGGLPETQAGLYAQFVDLVYDWKADEKILDQREAIDKALAQLALATMEQKDEVSRLRLRESWVLKVLGSRPIFQAVMRLGWLNRVERLPEAICVFYHATFQEYFAALAVDDWDYFLPRNHVNFPVAGKEYRIFEPQWKQVILLWLGRDIASDQKEEFIQELVEFKDGVIYFYEYQAYFLAAVGINEFKACSLALDIVRQVVTWGFGYFNIEKQKWQNFIDPIKEGARKAIPETIRPLAITEIIKIIENCPDKDIRKLAAESLREIGQANPQVIAALVKVIENTEDESTRREAAESLGKINPGNPQAIAALVKVIQNTEYEFTRREVAESLGKIGQANPQAIAALVKLIQTTEDEYTRWRAAESLGKIDPGNPQVIAALFKVIENTENEYTRKRAAESLGKIDPGNPQVIAALFKVIENNEEESTHWRAADSLGKIDPGNPQAIAALVKLIENTEDEDTRWLAAESLGEIGQANPQVIAALVKLIENTEDEDTRKRAAESLEEIGQGNPQAIAGLVKVIENNENEFTRWQAAESLEEIDPGNPQVIAALFKVIENTEDEDTRWRVAASLGKIDPGNPQAIAALVKVIENTEDGLACWQAAYSLQEILTTPKQYADIVSALKDCLSDEVYQNDFRRFDECIWHCAAKLPYPEFYQAWHGLTETQTSRLVQTLNLAQLPQLLQTQLTETNLHQTLQLLCIDGSKFDNRDNPATDIYLQLVKKHHCPKSTEGTPRTLTELKIYWQLLDWEKHPILIFYEDAKPQGFSQTFLDSLTRFDATICVITDSPHPTIPTFSPQDPHLIQTIMTWLQRTILET